MSPGRWDGAGGEPWGVCPRAGLSVSPHGHPARPGWAAKRRAGSWRAEQPQGWGNSPRVSLSREKRGFSPQHGSAAVSRLPYPLPLQVQRPLSEQTRALCKGSSGTCARSCLHPRQTLHRNTCGSSAIPGLSLLSTPGHLRGWMCPARALGTGGSTRGSVPSRREPIGTGL